MSKCPLRSSPFSFVPLRRSPPKEGRERSRTLAALRRNLRERSRKERRPKEPPFLRFAPIPPKELLRFARKAATLSKQQGSDPGGSSEAALAGQRSSLPSDPCWSAKQPAGTAKQPLRRKGAFPPSVRFLAKQELSYGPLLVPSRATGEARTLAGQRSSQQGNRRSRTKF